MKVTVKDTIHVLSAPIGTIRHKMLSSHNKDVVTDMAMELIKRHGHKTLMITTVQEEVWTSDEV